MRFYSLTVLQFYIANLFSKFWYVLVEEVITLRRTGLE